MRIAMLAPLIEAVPPALYGGTERVISVLTEELVRRGQEVTLFASGDSQTNGHLVAVCPHALRLHGGSQDAVTRTMVHLDEISRQIYASDVIHYHVDYFPSSSRASHNSDPHYHAWSAGPKRGT
jgi:hypothetical protein